MVVPGNGRPGDRRIARGMRRPRWRPSWGVLVLLILLPGCSQPPAEIGGARRESIVAYADPIVDNIVAGYNNGGFEEFSRDFDLNLRTAITADNFPTTRADLMRHLGRYLSRTVADVRNEGPLVVVLYRAVFEKAPDATIKAGFRPEYPDSGRRQLSDLVFDAPELR